MNLTKAQRDGWADALESGKYEQGAYKLVTKTAPRKFCCLGVYAKAVGKKNLKSLEGLGMLNTSVFPEWVQPADILHEPITHKGTRHRPVQGNFTYMNDNLGWDFKTIAKYVRKMPVRDE